MSRRVLVTGAASGLGLALVRRLAAAGDRVLGTDLAESATGLPDGVDYLRLDVRSEADWVAARDRVTARWDGLDVLVNNAGIASGGRIDVSTMEEWERVTDINLFGVVRGCRTFTPLFKAQSAGQIVNVASVAGLVHPPSMSSYNAVKAAVVALSETLQHELAPYGISTSVVCPGFFRTNLMSSVRGADRDAEQKLAALVERSPLTADDIAAAVVEGIAARAALILPDEPGRAAYRLKQSHRAAYDAQMAHTAQRAFERDQAAAATSRAEGPR